MESLVSLFEGITANQATSVHGGNIETLNNIIENHTGNDDDFFRIEELVERLREKVSRVEDIRALFARTNLEKMQYHMQHNKGMKSKIKVKDNNGNLVDLF